MRIYSQDMSRYSFSVGWEVGDVQSVAPSMSADAAEKFLADNEHVLRDGMIEHGLELIRELLSSPCVCATEEHHTTAYDKNGGPCGSLACHCHGEPGTLPRTKR
jgi:hypothetical protein